MRIGGVKSKDNTSDILTKSLQPDLHLIHTRPLFPNRATLTHAASSETISIINAVTHIRRHAHSSSSHLKPLINRAKTDHNRNKTHYYVSLSQPPLITRVARDFCAAHPSSNTRLNQDFQHARDSTNSQGWKPKQGTRRQDTGSLPRTLSQPPLINRVARECYDARPSSNMNQESQHARGSTNSWNYNPEHGRRRQDTNEKLPDRHTRAPSTTICQISS